MSLIKPTPMLYGVPHERLRVALREEMEEMGLGDEEIRKALQSHPLVDLLHAIQTIVQKPVNEHAECMRKWLGGELVPSSKQLARETMASIKGVLNAGKTEKNRSPGARGVS